MRTNMNMRRQRLVEWIATPAAAVPKDTDYISEMRVYPVREPASGRSYTVVQLRTQSALVGWGEARQVNAAQVEKAKSLIIGKPATSFAVSSTDTPLDAAITCAMLDITGKATSAPIYRVLGGPTRYKARAMAALWGTTDSELATSMNALARQGFQAFEVPIPSFNWRNQGEAFDKAALARMEGLRSAAPQNANFVLGSNSALTPSDAGAVASTLERFHLLWFDEPCPITNLRTIKKISDETVTPLGFGREIKNASIYQDLLREGLVDILRPNIQGDGIQKIRQVAALAETYYVAVAPNHDGGPIGTAAALQLAASLPNFFIQTVPVPADERDRKMRTELVPEPIETVNDGYFALPNKPGLGITVNEAALEKYKETAA
jgi:galactonate dehydratase